MISLKRTDCKYVTVSLVFLQSQIDRLSGHKNLPTDVSFENVESRLAIGWIVALIFFANRASEEWSELTQNIGNCKKSWSIRLNRYFFDIWNYIDFLCVAITGIY